MGGASRNEKKEGLMSFLIMLTFLRDVFGELLGHPFFKK